MDISVDIGALLLHAVTAVGLLEWTKRLAPALPKWVYAVALPIATAGVALSTLYEPALIWLRVWAWGQLAYKILVKLPDRLIQGKSGG